MAAEIGKTGFSLQTSVYSVPRVLDVLLGLSHGVDCFLLTRGRSESPLM